MASPPHSPQTQEQLLCSDPQNTGRAGPSQNACRIQGSILMAVRQDVSPEWHPHPESVQVRGASRALSPPHPGEAGTLPGFRGEWKETKPTTPDAPHSPDTCTCLG